jgi:UDP-glucose 4-epimerase
MANIIGTQNVLEAARKHEVKRFMFASTIYVYSELGSFYRVSKQSCEKIIEEYQREFDLDYTILRYGSLYGSRANEFNFIANSILQALKNKKIVRRGDGEEIREYIHVKDAARLSLDAIDDKFRNKHLIITGHQQIRVKDLLIMIKEIFGGEIEIEFGDEKELHHYEITPYNYKPQIAKKIISDTHYDLGQGLIDQIYDLEISLDRKNGSKKVSLRKRKK